MQIGLIGAGNMGSAMARGWGRPVLASDSGSGRAAALVAELGGEVATNEEIAERADLVVLAHKPAQLEQVAAGLSPTRVLSVLGGVTLEQLRTAYPEATVGRVEPNTPVALRQGVLLVPTEAEAEPLLEELGTVVRLPEKLIDVAGAISGVGPAYVALVAEAWADAGIRSGLPAGIAVDLVTETLAGAAVLLREQDTLTVRRGVTSPGGSTARGLAALEREGLRRAFAAATDDVIAA